MEEADCCDAARSDLSVLMSGYFTETRMHARTRSRQCPCSSASVCFTSFSYMSSGQHIGKFYKQIRSAIEKDKNMQCGSFSYVSSTFLHLLEAKIQALDLTKVSPEQKSSRLRENQNLFALRPGGEVNHFFSVLVYTRRQCRGDWWS